MLIEQSSVDRTICTLDEAGMRAYYTPGTAFADFVACGDMYFAGEIELAGWVCYLKSNDDEWAVCPPPHYAGRHNPEYRLPRLDKAVALTIFLYERRTDDESFDSTRHDEYTQRLVEEWQELQT